MVSEGFQFPFVKTLNDAVHKLRGGEHWRRQALNWNTIGVSRAFQGSTVLKLPLLLYLSRSVNAPLHSPEILQYLAGIKLVLIPYKRLLKSANNICTNINAIDKPTTKSKRKTSTEPFFVTRLVKVFVNIKRTTSVGQPGAN